jgi:hypothetical protein
MVLTKRNILTLTVNMQKRGTKSMPSAHIHLVSTLIKHKYTSHKNLHKEKLTRYKRATRRDITRAIWQLGN